jgi:hypothetical protein
MRKKMLFLVFALLLTSLSVLRADGTHACPRCTTYPDGSKCCVSCICDSCGIPIACTDNYCPPPDGTD